MKKYKLTIGILPKGAWGNDLSKTLSAKDWNEIKMNCYKKARHKCSICGFVTNDLDAHEVWEFDILSKTQILKDIIPICSKCHGVKHIKNSLRLGFEEKAKKHFIDVNNCSEFDFYSELARVIIEYNELNQIYRWKIKADLSKYTNKKIEIKNHYIPFINNPYSNEELKELKNKYTLMPTISNIEINNYSGIISVMCKRTNKIEWLCGDIKKTTYCLGEETKVEFSVKNLTSDFLQFKLCGSAGDIYSKLFKLNPIY